ncbi:hypothetical protein N5F13_21135 [Comamonas thiooxydans]|uniref:hypothetical protein n=1 Tax=Comamonas thiooxydans TaxID=363952 RepID=UPI00244ABAA7|nr:hypothetical protein [Comamonas thiooxydans]MDH1477010.1 hypothetical protein [Comamonas thiooxydans]
MTTQEPADFPLEVVRAREVALRLLKDLPPAGPPRTDVEGRGLMLSSRTSASRRLPPYYLVYFLLVDLLGYPRMGLGEKSAWTVPVRYQDRVYGIEHRKFGLGIFAPNLDPNARMSGTPNAQAEEDACAIADLVTQAVSAAEPYFRWRAEQAVSTPNLSVINKSDSLFARYQYFHDRFQYLSVEAELRKDETVVDESIFPDGSVLTRTSFPGFVLQQEADWNAQAAIEAFFSWTEHVFIHIAILLGKLRSGDEVARLADSDWKAKFKAALDIVDVQTKAHYDNLLDLRAQVRNFMAHGSFGKRGEAFTFHSGAGAVPVVLTEDQRHKFSLTGRIAFDEKTAIAGIESFLEHLWSGDRAPLRLHVFSGLPSILTHALDGTYKNALQSEEAMNDFVIHLHRAFDRAADMDW